MLDFLEAPPRSPTELARTHLVQIPCLQGRKLKPRERRGSVPAGGQYHTRSLIDLPHLGGKNCPYFAHGETETENVARFTYDHRAQTGSAGIRTQHIAVLVPILVQVDQLSVHCSQ